jgi:ABC-type Na+ efflux pump permease subunit
MSGFLTVILIVAMLGVLGILGLGMANLFTGGSSRRSNKLMQARVIMQGIALAVLAVLMMMAGHGHH